MPGERIKMYQKDGECSSKGMSVDGVSISTELRKDQKKS